METDVERHCIAGGVEDGLIGPVRVVDVRRKVPRGGAVSWCCAVHPRQEQHQDTPTLATWQAG